MGWVRDGDTRNNRGLPAMGWDGTVNQVISVNTDGEIVIANPGGGGGVSVTDDSAYTLGTDSLTPVGGQYSSTLDLVDDGDTGVFHMTQRRALHTNLRNVAGTEIGTASDPIRIDPTGSTTQPISGTVTVSQPVSVDDNGGSLTVDNAVLSVTGGGVEAGALRVTLANDSTGVVSVDDGGGSLTVDGTVTVTQPVSVDDNGGSLTIDNAALSVTGGGVEASALRVTLANDSTGVLSVDDNGGSLTVDGTVTSTPAGLSTLVGGTKTVASSATPEALAGSSSVIGVIVQALETNTDKVRVGPTGQEVYQLYPLDSVTIMVDDPSTIFVDVDVNGEGVVFLTLV